MYTTLMVAKAGQNRVLLASSTDDYISEAISSSRLGLS